MSKITMVIGASSNPDRFSHKAARLLKQYGHPVIAIGKRPGVIDEIEILNEKPYVSNVDTVTMYIGKRHQHEYYDYLTEVIRPKRIIFNPGAENEKMKHLAEQKGIEVTYRCTLVMLRTGEY